MAVDTSSNPYAYIQSVVVAGFALDPSRGYEARLAVLLAVTAYTTAASTALLILTILAFRKQRKPLYLCRFERRPQGWYLLVNQHIVTPIALAVVHAIWCAYVLVVRSWWGSGVTDTTTVYWVCLACVPLITACWVVNYAVLSGANLASARKNDPTKHILNPTMMNSTILVLLPLSLVAIFVNSVRVGQSFQHLSDVGAKLYIEAGEQAATWVPGTMEQTAEILMQWSAYFNELMDPPYKTMIDDYRGLTLAFIVSMVFLIAVNIAGGLTVLRSLRITDSARIVGRDVPIVAPLRLTQMIDPVEDNNEVAEILSVSASGEEGPEPWYGKSAAKAVEVRGRRLDWDIVAFYASIAPTCTVLLIYSVWTCVNAENAFAKGSTLEWETCLIQWLASVVIAVVTTLMCYKRIVQIRPPVRRMSIIIAKDDPSYRRRRQSRPSSLGDDDDLIPPKGIEVIVTSFKSVTYAGEKKSTATRKAEEGEHTCSSTVEGDLEKEGAK